MTQSKHFQGLLQSTEFQSGYITDDRRIKTSTLARHAMLGGLIRSIDRKWSSSPSTASYILLVLSDYAHSHGVAYPSNTTLVSLTGLSERSVRRAINDLVQIEVITREERPGTSSVYRLNIGKMWTFAQFYLSSSTDGIPGVKSDFLIDGDAVPKTDINPDSSTTEDGHHDRAGRSLRPPSVIQKDGLHDLRGRSPRPAGGSSRPGTWVTATPESKREIRKKEKSESRNSHSDFEGIKHNRQTISTLTGNVALTKRLKPEEETKAKPLIFPVEKGPIHVYEGIFELNMPSSSRDQVTASVTNTKNWKIACEEWKESGYNPRNISSLLDKYYKMPGNKSLSVQPVTKILTRSKPLSEDFKQKFNI